MKAGISLQELATEIHRQAQTKRDYLVPTDKMSAILGGDLGHNPKISFGDNEFYVNDVAYGQIVEHVGIPKKYADKMKNEAPALLAQNINAWFSKYPVPRLVRTLDSVNRAFLSDRYRPLENIDLAEAVLPALMDIGLDIMSCQITETRLYIKAVDPKVTRELKAGGGRFGDGKHNIVRCLAPAITISNSEVGMGALSVLAGVYDRFCSNLATFGERSVRKYHVGERHELGEDIYAMLSDETRRKTDAALWSQIGDVVRGAFERAAFNSLCDKIDEAATQKIEGDPIRVVELSSRRLGLSETERASVLRHLIEGGDLSRFGLQAAVTRASQDADSYDRASEMERLGGQIIELPNHEWRELAMAA